MSRPTLLAVALIIPTVAHAAAPSEPAAAPPAPTSVPASPADPAEDHCRRAAVARTLPGSDALEPGKVGACSLLATAVMTKLRELARQQPIVVADLNPMQPSVTDTAGAQSSAGQTAAVASGQPVAMAGGDVAAVGSTGQGLQLVTALAVNPATIAVGEVEQRSMWASRLGDISLVLPLNVDPGERLTQGFQYVGLRFRLDALPALHHEALETAAARYTALLADQRTLQPAIARMLGAATDTEGCAHSIETNDPTGQRAACGEAIDLATHVSLTRDARRALGQVREDADQAYLSLEGRYDRGDLNSDGADRKDSLLAAYLAGGYRIDPTPDGVTVGLRARAGFVYFKDGMTRQTRQALYGAAGVELAVVRDLQRYTLSLGAELVARKGNVDVAMDSTLHNSIRIGLGLPVANGRTVSVGLSIPTNGDDATIAISGDWSLLLGH